MTLQKIMTQCAKTALPGVTGLAAGAVVVYREPSFANYSGALS